MNDDAAGRVEPVEVLVRRHGATVLRVCRAVLGPGLDADDAWSETFLALLRAWPEVPTGTGTEAWLVRVAGRKCIDLQRAAHRRPIPVAEPPEPMRAPMPPNPAGVEHAILAEPAIWAEVAALPERQRQALAYHYFGGLRHTETAALLGISSAAVRRAAADGLKTLRLRHGPERPEA